MVADGIKGILDEIKEDAEQNSSNLEPKNYSNLEIQKQSSEKLIKRGYYLKPSTIKKLEEMKVFFYSVEVSLGDIVDEAICMLYESKKGE